MAEQKELVMLTRQDCALIADALMDYGQEKLRKARAGDAESESKATRAAELVLFFHNGIYDPGLAVTPS